MTAFLSRMTIFYRGIPDLTHLTAFDTELFLDRIYIPDSLGSPKNPFSGCSITPPKKNPIK
jgi:hypothetical protein